MSVAERYAEFRATLEPQIAALRSVNDGALNGLARGEFKRNSSKLANDRERNLKRQREKKFNKTFK